MNDLISSFYISSSDGKTHSDTQFEITVADGNSQFGFVEEVVHEVNNVYLNGVRLAKGSGNDFVVTYNSDNKKFVVSISNEWQLFNNDNILITT